MMNRYIYLISSLIRWLWYRPRFKRLGFCSVVLSPLHIDGGRNIIINKNVLVGYKTWLAAMPLTGRSPKLIIEKGCTIGNFNHIYATDTVILHENVLTADKVYIADNLHGYEDVTLPVLKQPIIQKGKVEIGEGSWLGENVCVIGAKIGKHCVIGANSVVTKDIPDFSIAVGAPAKVIKIYNYDEKKWQVVEGENIAGGGGGRSYLLVFAA